MSTASPSHTVGLELFLGKKLKTMLAESPSHTVGFKPYKLVKGLVETLLRESPSHTVGSELKKGEL